MILTFNYIYNVKWHLKWNVLFLFDIDRCVWAVWSKNNTFTDFPKTNEWILMKENESGMCRLLIFIGVLFGADLNKNQDLMNLSIVS